LALIIASPDELSNVDGTKGDRYATFEIHSDYDSSVDIMARGAFGGLKNHSMGTNHSADISRYTERNSLYFYG